jgi:NIPSNAP
MITLIRSTTMMPGKNPEAREWASEIGGVVSRITGNQVRVGMRIGGNVSEICWIVQFESLAQLEEQMTKWVSNAEFQAVAKRAEGLIRPGSTNDQIFQTN